MDFINYAANVLFGSAPLDVPQKQEVSPVNQAVIRLRDRGHSVQPSNIPGLWEVSGCPELTTGQLLDFAFNHSKPI